jgi:hypothetical protein
MEPTIAKQAQGFSYYENNYILNANKKKALHDEGL